MTVLKASLEFQIRFSEVDSMGFVWHGSYPLYFEDARECFGAKYGLEYMTIFHAGCYAPLVELNFQYKQPLTYQMRPRIDIIYEPTEAAKLTFRYEIHDTKDDSLIATGRSVQVFTDLEHQLLWENPPFFDAWKKKWGVL